MPTAVTHTSQARTHQTQAATASDATASSGNASGSFQDFMESYVAGLEGDQAAAGANGATSGAQGGVNGILALLAKLGVKTGDGSVSSDGTSGDKATGTDATKTTVAGTVGDGTGIIVPVATQPQLALGFTNDGSLVSDVAQKAIAAVTGGTPGAGLVVNAVGNVLGGSAAANGAAQTTAEQAAAAQAAANAAQTAAATGSDVAAKAGDTADLAAQGVVAIIGKTVAADADHTVANQTAPKADDPSANTAHVALTALQQSASLATTPMSRAADIRAKLQTAQLGAGKTSVTGAAEVGTGSNGTMGDLLSSTAGGTPATAAASGLLDATGKQAFAQFGEKGQAGAGGKAQDPFTVSDTTSDKSQPDGSGSTLSDRINAQFNASLSGLNQNQSAQSPAQAATLANQAIPYTAVASTLAAHAKAGSSEFNIRLDPAGLGQIDVKMKVSSDGQVRAHLIVDQPATLDLMMRDRQHLQQQLDQAGFKTDSSSLQFSLRDQGQGSSQQQAWQQQSASSRGQSQATRLLDGTSQVPSTVYARQSYIRSDAVDISI